ncbi:MAG: class I SAM-dependent methyltransferase [Bacteroidetes bacterium]|nr:MAG: class I SAM-dependent methyltransferase [Bacteroidota bacterium]
MIHTTEVTTYEIASDNVLNQRLSFAYYEAAKLMQGNLLEIGCGTGKGTAIFSEKCSHYTAFDKNTELTNNLSQKYPNFKFINQSIPPFVGMADHSFDSAVSLQVIEHIDDDHLFVKEIHRVLKIGACAVISTPNIKHSLSRNPWHVREYTPLQLETLLKKYFSKVELLGVKGNEKVMNYHEENRKSVAKITRFDIFNLQYNLPRFLLQIPYEILNRFNRNKLRSENNSLVDSVSLQDFSLSKEVDLCLDLFAIVHK